MALSPELRKIMAHDMLQNRKFDGDTDVPPETRAFVDLADMVTVERPAIDGFPYKMYIFTAKNKKADSPLHINIHGGGWLIPHMFNDVLWSAWVADQIQGVVVDLDYSTTKVASFPVPLHQCEDAVCYVLDHIGEWECDPKRVSMGGYSAGGQLTMSIMVDTISRGKKLPIALLINGYGPNDMRFDEAAAKAVPEYWKTQEHRSAGFGILMTDDNPAMLDDPTIDFMQASDEILAQLPTTMILGASNDVFRFQNLEQGKKLASLGVQVLMKIYPDTMHGFIPHLMPHWEEAGKWIVHSIMCTSI